MLGLHDRGIMGHPMARGTPKLTEGLNQGHDSATILNHREPRNHAQPAQAEVPTVLSV